MKPNQAMTHGHLPSALNKINVMIAYSIQMAHW